jgi:hypothetical protein
MRFQKHWYLGLLGCVGFYELPDFIAFFADGGSWWGLTSVLWFLWFLHFVPESASQSRDAGTPL